MGKLLQTIESDLISALKEKNQQKADVLRMLKSAIKTEEISHRTAGASNELSDEDTIKIIRREVKKRKESIASFRAGNREDLATKEEAELAHLDAYLPKEIPDADLIEKIQAIISKNQLTAADYGQAMKAIMAELKGSADGQRISALSKSLLK